MYANKKNMTKPLEMNILLLTFLLLLSCHKTTDPTIPPSNTAYQITKTINYNGISVDVVIDKPKGDEHNVLIVYHGTVGYDSLILEAAHNTLNGFKRILDRSDMMIVSVAYPEEHLLFGDNIQHAEAALLWIKNLAYEELGVKVKKIFLGGHSQGGYLVTRLNTTHSTNGVIANAPGPLNLAFRCQLEENGQIPHGMACTKLFNEYGNTSTHYDAYYQRSLLNFTTGFKSDILFIQGLDDKAIQMHSWPAFKQQIEKCTNCEDTQFLELPNVGHNALFTSDKAKVEFNSFINAR